jgi:hypothetical protein
VNAGKSTAVVAVVIANAHEPVAGSNAKPPEPTASAYTSTSDEPEQYG